MLNAKSIAVATVNRFNNEWTEEFFGSKEELIEELVQVLNQFEDAAELAAADDLDTAVHQYCGGVYIFKRDLLKTLSK